MNDELTIICGDALQELRELPNESVQCCVTSPPYWGLRDYNHADQLGLEPDPFDYVTKLVAIMREVRRVLRKDGTLWLNLGDSYGARGGDTHTGFNERWANNGIDGKQTRTKDNFAKSDIRTGLKPKDLCGIPWRVAFALQADGWWLRSDIIWAKPNPMPESVTDRPTKSHEYLFLLTKSANYFYDAEAIKERASVEPHAAGYTSGESYAIGPMSRNGHSQREGDQSRIWAESGNRNKRSVWTVATAPYPEAHFATYPPDLIKPCIMAGSRPGDTVLDPFAGSGTTGMVAMELGRKAILIELNPNYVELIRQRCDVTLGLALA